MSKIGDMSTRRGENLAAQGTYRSALNIVEELLRRDPNNTKTQGIVTAILNKLAGSGDGHGRVFRKRWSITGKSIAITDAALMLDPE